MSDKPVAGIVAFAAAAPLCALCALGTSGLASVSAWFAGWFGGFDWVIATAFALIVGILTYSLLRRRAARNTEKQAVALSKPMSRSMQ